MPDINRCQICGEAAPPIDGQCGEITGYRLVRDPWSDSPSFLDGNLHFSCLEQSDRRGEFHAEFVHLVQAGHEEIPGLEASHPPLTRMGLSMRPVFSGDECDIFQSRMSDRWMLVKKTGPWFGFGLPQLRAIDSGALPVSSSDVTRYRLPVDLGDEVGAYGLSELLEALGVAHRYADAAEPARVEYRFVDYYAPKRLLDYVAAAPLPLPEEAVAFLAAHAKTYNPVAFDEEDA
ncbi:hypothetical protein [Streptomyces sp. NBC_00151]|uniref:hypothetical protein n=1 Tax=Streptomyces sp. NBC_00151 TaxID=2975669 RepID=UPI002DDB015F|nr:hypothetical protein [Streptomyces sp. NBC_00151]WRZ40147.1 hypothetical protein OG915_20110 [Streptomyces sp. NBC_00151]